MKKFRPYKAGYIVMYALGVLCIGDAVISLIRQAMGTANEYMQSFSMFTYLIAILAFLYTKLYISTRVEVDDKTFHFVNTVYVKPAPDVKRASFIYRQGENDIKKIDKKFPWWNWKSMATSKIWVMPFWINPAQAKRTSCSPYMKSHW